MWYSLNTGETASGADYTEELTIKTLDPLSALISLTTHIKHAER